MSDRPKMRDLGIEPLAIVASVFSGLLGVGCASLPWALGEPPSALLDSLYFAGTLFIAAGVLVAGLAATIALARGNHVGARTAFTGAAALALLMCAVQLTTALVALDLLADLANADPRAAIGLVLPALAAGVAAVNGAAARSCRRAASGA